MLKMPKTSVFVALLCAVFMATYNGMAFPSFDKSPFPHSGAFGCQCNKILNQVELCDEKCTAKFFFFENVKAACLEQCSKDFVQCAVIC
ncbi:hypothetical protein DPMN_170178 [Dreissena polymorpha]|uniref:Uncharacterized protein n=1 Tax=Dreissena polymorpha TaxID=45954 RepID=A0A9D4DXW6_DREPO|nr:hypothetical protein DPMN_170178 [Dreissena polymorpha]